MIVPRPLATRACAWSSLVIVALLVAAPRLAAQPAPLPDAVELLPESRAERPVALVTRGRSNAIRAVVAPIESHLPIEALRHFGDGWEQGHRWTLVADGLPGTPVLPPAAWTAVEGNGIVAPAIPGAWRLESASGTAVSVLVPYASSLERGGMLNGYHIGEYPAAGGEQGDAYRPPAAFIEVMPDTRETAVSRHLTLGAFLTKDQLEVWPKYVALDLRLIDKLELVLAELNAMGIRADRLHVMSGFRTPQYNGPGGDGRATLSRHMWGDAADVWVDNDSNGFMDDLNGDQLFDIDDAAVVMRALERVEAKNPELVGGAGIYPTTPTHGPYIHIDARGTRARW